MTPTPCYKCNIACLTIFLGIVNGPSTSGGSTSKAQKAPPPHLGSLPGANSSPSLLSTGTKAREGGGEGWDEGGPCYSGVMHSGRTPETCVTIGQMSFLGLTQARAGHQGSWMSVRSHSCVQQCHPVPSNVAVQQTGLTCWSADWARPECAFLTGDAKSTAGPRTTLRFQGPRGPGPTVVLSCLSTVIQWVNISGTLTAQCVALHPPPLPSLSDAGWEGLGGSSYPFLAESGPWRQKQALLTSSLLTLLPAQNLHSGPTLQAFPVLGTPRRDFTLLSAVADQKEEVWSSSHGFAKAGLEHSSSSFSGRLIRISGWSAVNDLFHLVKQKCVLSHLEALLFLAWPVLQALTPMVLQRTPSAHPTDHPVESCTCGAGRMQSEDTEHCLYPRPTLQIASCPTPHYPGEGQGVRGREKELRVPVFSLSGPRHRACPPLHPLPQSTSSRGSRQ